jgi:hypothetical protein
MKAQQPNARQRRMNVNLRIPMPLDIDPKKKAHHTRRNPRSASGRILSSN